MPAAEPTSYNNCSKSCVWKLVVLIAGCATFALYASSERYDDADIKKFVLAGYIISWVISLLLFFARITGLSLHMNTPCMSFNSFDYFWSWFSCLNFFTCSVILACFFGNCDPACGNNGSFCSCAQQLTALLLGVLTAVLYVFEAQNLRLYAPWGSAYGTTWRGIWKMFVLVIGGTAWGFLVHTGYICSRNAKTGCTEARTFVLVAWCVAWSVSALIYFIYICGIRAKTTVENQMCCSSFEFFWSAFSCLLYLIGAAVYAGFLECSEFRSFFCRSRLAADICGFVTAILFAVDAYQLRAHTPTWFRRTGAPPGSAPRTAGRPANEPR